MFRREFPLAFLDSCPENRVPATMALPVTHAVAARNPTRNFAVSPINRSRRKLSRPCVTVLVKSRARIPDGRSYIVVVRRATYRCFHKSAKLQRSPGEERSERAVNFSQERKTVTPLRHASGAAGERRNKEGVSLTRARGLMETRRHNRRNSREGFSPRRRLILPTDRRNYGWIAL